LTWFEILAVIGRALVPAVGVFFAAEGLGSIANGATRIMEGNESMDWRNSIEFPLRGLRIAAGILLASLAISPSMFVGAGIIFVVEASLAIGFRMDEVNIEMDGKKPKIDGPYGGSLRMKSRFARGLLGIILLEVGHFI